MRLQAVALQGSPKDEDCDDLAHVFCWSDTGYFFSLAREPGERVIEVIVLDQINSRTRDISATLSSGKLLVKIPTAIAAKLDGNTEYEILFEASPEQLNMLHSSLAAIFDQVGKYEKDF